jgi:hypothetical protein
MQKSGAYTVYNNRKTQNGDAAPFIFAKDATENLTNKKMCLINPTINSYCFMYGFFTLYIPTCIHNLFNHTVNHYASNTKIQEILIVPKAYLNELAVKYVIAAN